MGASPVIIDDGGSTRIKRVMSPPGIGEMDSLMSVDDTVNPPISTADARGPFKNVKIVWIEKNGKANEILSSPLKTDDKFTLVSHNGQKLTLIIDRNEDCQITLTGRPNSVPLVEAKQFKGKRRYMVANAGPIKTIDGVANGNAIKRFDAEKAESVYTTLVLS